MLDKINNDNNNEGVTGVLAAGVLRRGRRGVGGGDVLGLGVLGRTGRTVPRAGSPLSMLAGGELQLLGHGFGNLGMVGLDRLGQMVSAWVET